jgi:hypothetical protein
MASASTLPNLYQGVEKESFGYKLLANLGWKEGQGLVRAMLLVTGSFCGCSAANAAAGSWCQRPLTKQ